MRQSTRDGANAGCFIAVVAVFLLAISILYTSVHYALLPTWLNAETNANRASYQYVQTKADLLLKLQQDYESPDATDAQRAAIVNRMKAERALIPPEQVPPATNAFLRGK